MTQKNVIQTCLVGMPACIVLLGVASLIYHFTAPKAESREGGRPAEMLAVPVTEKALRGWVQKLAVDIGPRPAQDPTQMRITAKWIQSELSEENMGYKPQVQIFEADDASYRNVIAELPGGKRAGEVIVIGAHYDSVPDCPAANDNGTGVAALLGVARALSGTENERTLRFVAFANEEPPHFQTDTMGSLVYARSCKQRGDNVVGMISLETMGYYDDRKGSQSFPAGLRRFYPDTGNFIGIVGNVKSKALVDSFHSKFTTHSDFPAEKAALPAALPGVGWSDQWSFWKVNYPALMITDTAVYRYPHYHLKTDTPDKIDFPRFTKVTKGVVAAVRELANPGAAPKKKK